MHSATPRLGAHAAHAINDESYSSLSFHPRTSYAVSASCSHSSSRFRNSRWTIHGSANATRCISPGPAARAPAGGVQQLSGDPSRRRERSRHHLRKDLTITNLEHPVMSLKDGNIDPTIHTALLGGDSAQRPPSPSSSSSSPIRYAKRAGNSLLHTAVIILAVTCSTLLSSIISGIFSVAIPTIGFDVGLERALLLWPQSLISLVSACTLLVCGAIADVVGNKRVYVVGSALQAAAVLGCGLAVTGPQVLVLRGVMGLAQSMCLPTSVSIISNSIPAGRQRNLAFACMGGGQPLGFSVGLLMGGVLTSTIGWRVGMFVVAGVNAAVVLVAIFGLDEVREDDGRGVFERLAADVDWVGALIISVALGLFCYVCGAVSADVSSIRSGSSIALLCLAIALTPAFALWMGRQTARGRPALISNSLWKNVLFTSTNLCVFFTWGAFNTLEQIMSLWMQLVQHDSPLIASIKFLPQTIVGVIVTALVGFSLDRFSGGRIIILSTLLSTGAPVLMALSSPSWIYWAAVFPALCLNVLGADCLYTISNLVISDIFSPSTQGLAGGVFNTVAQVGKSLGLALGAVVTEAVIAREGASDDGVALIHGYQASFWFVAVLFACSLCIAVAGLRKLGKVGTKAEP